MKSPLRALFFHLFIIFGTYFFTVDESEIVRTRIERIFLLLLDLQYMNILNINFLDYARALWSQESRLFLKNKQGQYQSIGTNSRFCDNIAIFQQISPISLPIER